MEWEDLSYNKYKDRTKEEYINNNNYYRLYEDFYRMNTYSVEQVYNSIEY